jgi:sugar O-acyltransferase (sialic acid O-acetyltransferase NeuD family)
MGFEEIYYKDWKQDGSAGIIMGLMKPENKIKVYEFFKASHNIGFEDYESLIHPGTDIAETATLGRGIITNPGLVIGPYAEIGDIVSINRNVGIGHHSRISNFCTINPGVNIAGFVEVGEAATIGMGANILEHVKIGKNTFIGAGSLVTKDIPDNIIAYGSPAKIIREKEL